MASPVRDELVIGIDCSTTAAKAVVIDADGQTVATGYVPLQTTSPRPGWHEQDAETWWAATTAAVRQAVSSSGRAADIAAICITHQRESFVCLDETGTPLRPAILWLDGRAQEQIDAFGSATVESLSGKPADITPALYKIAWLARHEPELLQRTYKIADTHGFLVHRMTGQWVTSISSADPLSLLDVTTQDYAESLLSLAGVRRDQMLDLQPAGHPISELTPGIAREWGLAPSTIVIAGVGDGQAAGLGANVVDSSHGYLNLGTAVLLGTERNGYQPSRDYRSLISVIDGNTTLETFLSSGAYLPNWFRRAFGGPGATGAPDPVLETAARALPAGSDHLLTLPYWNAAQTPHWDSLATGAIIGWRSAHTPAHMYRSLLEGVAFELRNQLDGLERATGQRLISLRGMGGGTRSALWVQIVADVLERPIELCTEPEISALGAAIVGHTAIGTLPGPQTGRRRHDLHRQVIEPDISTADTYGELRRHPPIALPRAPTTHAPPHTQHQIVTTTKEKHHESSHFPWPRRTSHRRHPRRDPWPRRSSR